MTTDTTSSTQPTSETSPDVPEPSGADLARIALQAARADARKNGAPKARRPRRRTLGRGTGREPQGFGAVLQSLVAERAWELPAAGGTLLDAWAEIAAAAAPRLADHIQALAYDTETSRLDLRADSPAYATQARLMTPHLIAAANQHAGREAVLTIRVLDATATARTAAPGPDSGPTPATAAASSVKSRAEASAGYRQALAAHKKAKPEQPRVSPAIAEARQRQNRALNAHRHATFAAEEQQLLLEAEREEARDPGASPASARARALQRLAAERAGRAGSASARLGRTV